jgi:hypothetical protein
MADRRDEDEPAKLPDTPAVPRTFTPLKPEELTDPALLPRQFRFLQGEVRELIGVLRHQVLPGFAEMREIIGELRTDLHRERAARAALEERVAELSVAVGLAR